MMSAKTSTINVLLATGKKLGYKDDLLVRLGGEETLDFAILSLCERIMGDPRLRPFYQTFDNQTLSLLQKEFVLLSIAKLPDGVDGGTRMALRTCSTLK
jgi:hypothetical protein